jgi:hypothetical protein
MDLVDLKENEPSNEAPLPEDGILNRLYKIFGLTSQEFLADLQMLLYRILLCISFVFVFGYFYSEYLRGLAIFAPLFITIALVERKDSLMRKSALFLVVVFISYLYILGTTQGNGYGLLLIPPITFIEYVLFVTIFLFTPRNKNESNINEVQPSKLKKGLSICFHVLLYITFFCTFLPFIPLLSEAHFHDTKDTLLASATDIMPFVLLLLVLYVCAHFIKNRLAIKCISLATFIFIIFQVFSKVLS